MLKFILENDCCNKDGTASIDKCKDLLSKYMAESGETPDLILNAMMKCNFGMKKSKNNNWVYVGRDKYSDVQIDCIQFQEKVVKSINHLMDNPNSKFDE